MTGATRGGDAATRRRQPSLVQRWVLRELTRGGVIEWKDGIVLSCVDGRAERVTIATFNAMDNHGWMEKRAGSCSWTISAAGREALKGS